MTGTFAKRIEPIFCHLSLQRQSPWL